MALIATYFSELLNNELMELDHFVTLFDESHNKFQKQGQMDLHVCYWNHCDNIVATRYYTSEFLGKAAATNICQNFEVSRPIAKRENDTSVIRRSECKSSFP